MFDTLLGLIHDIYGKQSRIGLHEPVFGQAEREAMIAVIDSGMVSSVGPCVEQFERQVADYTGAPHAVAVVNGTSALQMALHVAGVQPRDLVLTQSLTFVATCNAIRHCGADPVFIDVERQSLGLSVEALARYLDAHAERDAEGRCRHRASGRRISACMPMHTFGNPMAIAQVCRLCEHWGIVVVEDSAEALGSCYQGRHCGTFGAMGVLSFNGNKILTTGGGGMVLVRDGAQAARLRHLTTTARVVDTWHWSHDEVAWNHRMPNLNAALGIAQFATLASALQAKQAVAERYRQWADAAGRELLGALPGAEPNHWLPALICADADERAALLRYLGQHGVMARPVWVPMHRLPMYRDCWRDALETTEWAADRVLSLPGSVPVARSDNCPNTMKADQPAIVAPSPCPAVPAFGR